MTATRIRSAIPADIPDMLPLLEELFTIEADFSIDAAPLLIWKSQSLQAVICEDREFHLLVVAVLSGPAMLVHEI